MARSARYGKPDGAADMRDYARLVAATFGGEIEPMQAWISTMGVDAVRVLRGEAEIDAGLTLYNMGQYFGDCSVPSWGLAGVVIPSHARGEGRARELLEANLREQFESGPPIAVLYPASTAVYRKLGYEQAGQRITARIRPVELQPAYAELDTRPIEAADWPALRQVYAAARRHDNGCLDRSNEIWERKRRVPPAQILQGTIFERKGQPEGYLLFTLTRTPPRLRLNMAVHDWACTTPDAAEALMAQIYGQRSVVEDVTLQVAPNDPLIRHFVHDQNVPITESMLWMLRIVRAQDALTARGWPEIRCEAAFSLIDELIPENRGHWRLRVQDGKAEVERTRRAEIGLHIRGLAALYSGFQTPAGLRKLGLLQGEDKHDAALAAMFAGPAPWMPDYF